LDDREGEGCSRRFGREVFYLCGNFSYRFNSLRPRTGAPTNKAIRYVPLLDNRLSPHICNLALRSLAAALLHLVMTLSEHLSLHDSNFSSCYRANNHARRLIALSVIRSVDVPLVVC
jgi:hypothetical protein